MSGNVTGDSEVILDARNPLFLILVRTNLSSRFVKKIDVKMSLFFDQYYIDPAEPSTIELNKKRDFFLKNTKNYLLFEHYFFGNLFNLALPTLRRPDQDILQDLARNFIASSHKENKTFDLEAKIRYFYLIGDSPTLGHDKISIKQDLDLTDDADSVSFVEMSEETFKNLILKFGKKSTRSWSLKEYKIYEWVLHSDNFLAFFYENKEDKVFYEEIKSFESTGLIMPPATKNIFNPNQTGNSNGQGQFEK